MKLNAHGADGDKVAATLLLDQGAPLMIETSNSDLPDPDNAEAVEYMRDQMTRIGQPHVVHPLEEDEIFVSDFHDSLDDHGRHGA